jgi:hypothetical protein
MILDSAVETAIEGLGFPKPWPVHSLKSVAHLFRSKNSRCGIYVLVFPHETVYIGQAVEVVRRFAQHRANYENIVGLAFIAVDRDQLNSRELALIHRAEDIGLLLLNTVHASNVTGDSDLDLVLSASEQSAWLSAPELFNQADLSAPLILPDRQVERFARRFEALLEHPRANTVLQLSRHYVHACLPAPMRTEYSFWVASCLPATNRNTWPRLVCLSAAMMETFVVGYLKGDKNGLWGFVNVATDVLFDGYAGEAAFRDARPSIDVVQRNYRDAGQYQVSLHATDTDALVDLMADPIVRQAAGVLALRVMRKRATIYSKFHCKQLAACLLTSVPISNSLPHPGAG